MERIVEAIIPMIGMVVFFAFVTWVIWLLNRTGRERRMRMMALQEKMFERFGSSQEFVAFLQTPEGQRFFKSLSQEPVKNPKLRIMKSVRTGVILIILAAGLIAISFLVGFHRPTEEPPFIIGFLSMFLGIGFIGSAAVSYFMSKSWGLLPEDREPVSNYRS